MICPRCRKPIESEDATGTMTFEEREYVLHASCGRFWRERLRRQIIVNCRENDRLAAEVRSLVIHAPADPDGLELRDGEIVAGWPFG